MQKEIFKSLALSFAIYLMVLVGFIAYKCTYYVLSEKLIPKQDLILKSENDNLLRIMSLEKRVKQLEYELRILKNKRRK